MPVGTDTIGRALFPIEASLAIVAARNDGLCSGERRLKRGGGTPRTRTVISRLRGECISVYACIPYRKGRSGRVSTGLSAASVIALLNSFWWAAEGERAASRMPYGASAAWSEAEGRPDVASPDNSHHDIGQGQ